MSIYPKPAKPYRFEANLLRHDESDAARLVSAAVTLAAMPGMISQEARALAVSTLRDLSPKHPRAAEVLCAMVEYIESYGS